MRPLRIVRSKYILVILFTMLITMMMALGLAIPGYLPFGTFGEPDPTVLFTPLIIDAFIAVFWFRSYLLYITDGIFTIRGKFRVHSREPINIIDPLKYVRFNKIDKLSKPARAALADMVHEKYGPTVDFEQRHMGELLMPIIKEFRDTEFKKYLSDEKYDVLVHGVMLQEYREDGGNRAFGRRGARASGNAVLVNPYGMVRNYGSDAICYANIWNYWGVDLFGYDAPVSIEKPDGSTVEEMQRFPGVPHYIIFAVLDHNPNFKLGDHMICYGTEPLHDCVRALVEDNEKVDESELMARPKWIYTFAAPVAEINSTARIQYTKDLIEEFQESMKRQRDSFDVAKEAEDKVTPGKKEEEAVQPVPVDEDGKEEEK